MGKGEIVHYKQFLLFPQCFQKACFPGASKGVIVWEWVKSNQIGVRVSENISNLFSLKQEKMMIRPKAVIDPEGQEVGFTHLLKKKEAFRFFFHF